MEGSVAELRRRKKEGDLDQVLTTLPSPRCLHGVPGAGGKGGGEGRDEARQEAVGVLAREAKVDERQDDASVDDVAQDGGEDVFAQTGDQRNHILHLHDLTAHQEHDAEGDVPGRRRTRSRFQVQDQIKIKT